MLSLFFCTSTGSSVRHDNYLLRVIKLTGGKTARRHDFSYMIDLHTLHNESQILNSSVRLRTSFLIKGCKSRVAAARP